MPAHCHSPAEDTDILQHQCHGGPGRVRRTHRRGNRTFLRRGMFAPVQRQAARVEWLPMTSAAHARRPARTDAAAARRGTRSGLYSIDNITQSDRQHSAAIMYPAALINAALSNKPSSLNAAVTRSQTRAPSAGATTFSPTRRRHADFRRARVLSALANGRLCESITNYVFWRRT